MAESLTIESLVLDKLETTRHLTCEVYNWILSAVSEMKDSSNTGVNSFRSSFFFLWEMQRNL